MSTLTKVLALLVSAIAIFLCGVVVDAFANAEDLKDQLSDETRKIKQAKDECQIMADQLEASVVNHQGEKKDLNAELSRVNDKWTEAKGSMIKAISENGSLETKANQAVVLSSVLAKTIDGLTVTNTTLVDELSKLKEEVVATKTMYNEMARKYNSSVVMVSRLQTNVKHLEEKLHVVENEKAVLASQLRRAAVVTGTETAPVDNVNDVAVAPSGIPIRGEVTDVDENRIAISVGTSSGVRKGMSFNVVRGDKYLGNLEVIYVRAGDAVGHLTNPQGNVVKGDIVVTGFDL